MNGHESEKILQMPVTSRSSNGNGGGFDAWRVQVDGRLAALDSRLATLDREVATLNERTQHLATKADVSNALLKMLLWMLGGTATLALIILTAIKLFILP